VYDVEAYLEVCLQSLGLQLDRRMEVILVDDGSSDDSLAIARAWARKRVGVRVLAQEHQGLSAARNRGVGESSGTFLAFCDADDVVPEGSYRTLLASLQETGSDFVSGNVRRFDSSGIWAHPRYGNVFATDRLRTHITRDHRLVLDRMAWNKVFRRSFWDRAGLRFALREYEDASVMIRAHLLADAVDVLSRVVYHWRVRDFGPRSITQRLYEPSNIEARMTMATETGQVIQSIFPPLLSAFAADIIHGDFWVLACAAASHSDEEMYPATLRANEFVAMRDPDCLMNLSPDDQELVRRVADLDIPAIRKLGVTRSQILGGKG